MLAAVILLRGREKRSCVQQHPGATASAKSATMNGSGKAVPKSPKVLKKAKSESTKEELSAIMITDL